MAFVVFYNDGNTADTGTYVLWNGNDSKSPRGQFRTGWDETLTGVQ